MNWKTKIKTSEKQVISFHVSLKTIRIEQPALLTYEQWISTISKFNRTNITLDKYVYLICNKLQACSYCASLCDFMG